MQPPPPPSISRATPGGGATPASTAGSSVSFAGRYRGRPGGPRVEKDRPRVESSTAHPVPDGGRDVALLRDGAGHPATAAASHARASGVTVSDACKTTYEEIKKDKKHRYVVFYIKDEKQIDVEVIGDRNAAYEQFLEDLQKGGVGECRYGLFDFEYTHQCQGTSEASKKQKLFLMSWCPDTAKVKKKMLYSSSFDALKKSLVGVQKYIQATDLSEASEEAVEEKLRATDRQ